MPLLFWKGCEQRKSSWSLCLWSSPHSLSLILRSCQSELTKMLRESHHSSALTSLMSLWTEVQLLGMILNSPHNLSPCLCNESRLSSCLSYTTLCPLHTTETSAVSDPGHKHVVLVACRSLDQSSGHLDCSEPWPHTYTHSLSFSRIKDIPWPLHSDPSYSSLYV